MFLPHLYSGESPNNPGPAKVPRSTPETPTNSGDCLAPDPIGALGPTKGLRSGGVGIALLGTLSVGIQPFFGK